MSAEKPRMSIYELLRSRYPAKTHALMFEVRDGAGFSASRSCDAIAISTWPSRGLELMGFEIKASRADWLREVRNPEKADTFSVVCDKFYVVADGKDIVQPDEVPASWGWLQRVGNRLVCEKAAPTLTPVPLDRSMLAAMLKRAIDQASAPGEQEFKRGVAIGREEGKKDAERHHAYQLEEHDRLKAAIREFEQASGVAISTWNAGKIGEAVRTVLDGGHLKNLHRVPHLVTQFREITAHLERLAQELPDATR